MSRNPIVTFAQDRLDTARREIKAAVIDFDVSDEKLLELRANARSAYEELRAMDAKLLKKGICRCLSSGDSGARGRGAPPRPLSSHRLGEAFADFGFLELAADEHQP